jgi:hypothetical protein
LLVDLTLLARRHSAPNWAEGGEHVDDDRKVVETKTEARQGVTGTGASSVLIWSLGLAILAFVVLMAWFVLARQ